MSEIHLHFLASPTITGTMWLGSHVRNALAIEQCCAELRDIVTLWCALELG
jgi:hypothetical protein